MTRDGQSARTCSTLTACSFLLSALVAFEALGLGHVAHAHAPLARAVSISADEDVAISAPLFGFALRAGSDGAFGYACNEMLGIDVEATSASWIYRQDTRAVIASHALAPTIVDRQGCDARLAAGWPTGVGAAAIASDPQHAAELYGVTAETTPRVYRSVDDGEHWQLQGTLDANDAGDLSATLHLTASTPSRLYIARQNGGQTEVLRSIDQGASFSSMSYGATFTLLHVEAGDPDVLWAMAERAETRDVALLRGAIDDAVLDEVHRVRFFGGFALDEMSDTAWIADEAGALFRSDDGADFSAQREDLAIGCLAWRAGKLWACTTGTSQQPALMTSIDRGDTFAPVVAFAQVSQLVDCAVTRGETNVCAAAWNEWRADVLSAPTIDAGVDAGATDAAVDADAQVRPRRSDSGCQIQNTTPAASSAWCHLGALWLLCLRRGVRRA